MTTRLSTILAAICVVLTAPSQAADSGLQAMMQDLGAVLAWRLGPEAIEERCQAADPEGVAIRKKAASDWLDKNADLIRQVDVRVAEYEYNRRRCTRVETTQLQPGAAHHRSVVYFDRETALPVRVECYDWPCDGSAQGELIEVYSYLNLRLNPGLSDDAFEH